MRRCAIVATIVLLLPAAASARDVMGCAKLYRALSQMPMVPGSTDDAGAFALELTDRNTELRNLRIRIRNAGCGSGSIVTLGGTSAGVCQQLSDELQTKEMERDDLTAKRNEARRPRPTEERLAVQAAIRENGCIPSDIDELDHVKISGIEIPKEEEDTYSGVIRLTTKAPNPTETAKQAALDPPVPDRPYDPSKKVRMVGPQFLPSESIDLAHPK